MNNEVNRVGVGPCPKPWPTGDEYDKYLLENGDRRNVEDKYRYWKVEAIKADLTKRAVPLEIAIENWQHDFNIGTIVRNSNAFNVRAVHIIGRRHWNRRGAMVTDAYLTIHHHRTIDDFCIFTKGKVIIAVDNIPGAKSIYKYNIPKNSILVFGAEGPGVSDEMIRIAKETIFIPQRGSTRSVNVGVASGIVLYKWSEANGYIES